MKIRLPSRDTCAECWKYKNKLGVISRHKNQENQWQVCTDINGDEQLDGQTVESEHLNINNNNTNTSNNQGESYYSQNSTRTTVH